MVCECVHEESKVEGDDVFSERTDRGRIVLLQHLMHQCYIQQCVTYTLLPLQNILLQTSGHFPNISFCPYFFPPNRTTLTSLTLCVPLSLSLVLSPHYFYTIFSLLWGLKVKLCRPLISPSCSRPYKDALVDTVAQLPSVCT